MVCGIILDRYKVGAHDLEKVVVDGENESRINRSINETKQIFFAL